MGMYLCVQDAAGKDHPDWDWGLAGDRDIAHVLFELPRVFRPEPDEDGMGAPEPEDFRPMDIGAWYEAADAFQADHNPGRFRQLVELLEREPDFWVHISW